ncbi:MAG: hypothetical protein ACUVQZ_00275 [Candidatus Caldatribacteriaceae bacterium]
MENIIEEGVHLIITVNSPGEVYYWLWPFLEELQHFSRRPRIWVFVPPCQFATGREVDVIRDFPLVERVFSPWETLFFIFKFSPFVPSSPGLVIFMGGDIFYALLLKKKTGYPLWVYGISSPRWISHVDRYLIRFPKDIPFFPQEKSVYVGDLLASAVAKRKTNPLFPSGFPRFLFLPGSRKFAYKTLFSLFQTWSQALLKQYPQASFAMGLPSHYYGEELPKVTGIKIFFGRTSDLIQEADLIIAVPGSNNLEIVYRGKKGLVVLPTLQDLARVPVMGFLAIWEKIPFWGKMIKRKLLSEKLQKTQWISLPNIMWEREILVELKGEINVEHFLKAVEMLLGKEEERLSEEEKPSPFASFLLAKLVQGVESGAEKK